MDEFSHLDDMGNIKMVDVTNKLSTVRIAKASGKVNMDSKTILAINNDEVPKGNVLTAAKISGINGAKKTADFIPLCHQINLSFIDVKFEIDTSSILIRSIVKTKESTGVEMEALSAVSSAALTIYDMCKAMDKTMSISSIKLEKKVGGKTDHATGYRPTVGVITLSDGVKSGDREDISGKILVDGFRESGCKVEHQAILEDGSNDLVPTIQNWVGTGVELILTTGGTGLGPRDLTIETVEEIFDSKIPGIEQALHSYGRGMIKTAMLSRLTAGITKESIIICLPGSPGAVKDALVVLIPTIFHSFHMMKGEKH